MARTYRFIQATVISTLCLLLGLAGSAVGQEMPAPTPAHPALSASVLSISGLIGEAQAERTVHLEQTQLDQLPRHQLHTSTAVTDGVKRFDGVLVRDVLALVGVSSAAQTVDAYALNDYSVSVPLSDFYTFDVLLATHMDGAPLTPADKGPLWIVYPRDQHHRLQDIRYDYRWVWQLKSLHIR